MANAGEEGQPKPPLPFPLEILVEISVLGSFLYPRNGNLQRQELLASLAGFIPCGDFPFFAIDIDVSLKVWVLFILLRVSE